jgi:hypothetical protein
LRNAKLAATDWVDYQVGEEHIRRESLPSPDSAFHVPRG